MSFKNQEVLNFYEKLPFNIYGDLNAAIDQIKDGIFNCVSELYKN